MRSTLVVTNDFGPRAGGIESFVNAMVERLPRGSVVVHTSEQEGAREYDERLLRDFDIAVVESGADFVLVKKMLDLFGKQIFNIPKVIIDVDSVKLKAPPTLVMRSATRVARPRRAAS